MILTSTLHDPSATLLDSIAAAATNVHRHYETWVVRVTGNTDEAVIQRLKDCGVKVIGKEAESEIDNPIENDHLIALRGALVEAQNKNDKIIHYQDGDRVIMAASRYEDDFAETVKDVQSLLHEKGDNPTLTYINLRRSGQDYATHHAALLQTELDFNTWYTGVMGIPLDIGSTSHVMTSDVVEQILKRSPELERVNFPHPIWLMVAKEMKADINSIETRKVGAFETPLQYRKQVAAGLADRPVTILSPNTETGGTDSRIATDAELSENYGLQTQVYLTTEGLTGLQGNFRRTEWNNRFNNVEQYLSFLRAHLDVFAIDQESIPHYEGAIARTLESVARQRVLMEELLPENGMGPLDPRRDIESRISAYSQEFRLTDPRNRDEDLPSTVPDAGTRPGIERF